MAYNKELEKRISDTLDEINPPGLIAKKMFGGVGYMLKGNMACGVLEDQLIVRIGKDGYDDALKKPGVSKFHSRGRAMAGWVVVDVGALENDDALRSWVQRGVDFALALPPK